MTTLDTYWKVSLYSTSTKRMLFSSGSVSRGPFLSHQAGYHYHSYSLGLVLKSTITIHEYTSQCYQLKLFNDIVLCITESFMDHGIFLALSEQIL